MRPDAPTIAVYPLYNISGVAVAEEVIGSHLTGSLAKYDIQTIPQAQLDRFIKTCRVRDVGGIDSERAQQLRETTNASAVLITTLEMYVGDPPPRIAVTSRLVSLADEPAIVWMESASRAGNDSRGFLDLGVIEDPERLAPLVTDRIAKSLGRYLHGKQKTARLKPKGRRFLPKVSFESPVMKEEAIRRVAVVPFYNAAGGKHAGEIVALEFVRQCLASGTFRPIEPGVIRNALLGLRVMMEDGISLSNADIVLDRLDADALITGTVLEYEDPMGDTGAPAVSFSTFLVERRRRQIVWSSKSFGRGDDGVYLFDFGKKYTAHDLLSIMASNVVALMTKEQRGHLEGVSQAKPTSPLEHREWSSR